jgi:hypothetical protein
VPVGAQEQAARRENLTASCDGTMRQHVPLRSGYGRVVSAGWRGVVREPLTWILVVAALLRLPGVVWGLPAADGWDNDGIAPRDFLPGLLETFTWGHYFTYPAAHLGLLALLTLPITLVAVAHVATFTPAALVEQVLHVSYMTAYSLVARLVAVAMSLGIIGCTASIAGELRGRAAGRWAAATSAANVLLVYYGATSNLDVPCLFWGMMALRELTRSVARDEPRRLTRFAVLAALAIASKDQAYALFLGVPLVVIVAAVLADDSSGRRRWMKTAVAAAFLGAGLVLLLDGAVFNPTGFVARLRFLVGPASQPHAYYTADAAGRALVLRESLRQFDEYYPLPFAVPVVAGLLAAARTKECRQRLAALVPLAGIVSFTLAFNCVARRTEHRFLLPQMCLWAVYAGMGLDVLVQAARRRWVRGAVLAAVVLVFAFALFRCADVGVNLTSDPRYDAEAWLRDHVSPGDTLEVEGKSVYLPRLPPQANNVRVGPEPTVGRNPVHGAREVQDLLIHVDRRQPRWIVTSRAYNAHFTGDLGARFEPGRIRSAFDQEASTDGDESTFFRGLYSGQLGYRLAHRSTWMRTFWPRLDIHGSTSPDIDIFERGT